MVAAAAAGDAQVDELIERASFFGIDKQDRVVRQARMMLSKTAAWTSQRAQTWSLAVEDPQ